MPTAVQMASKHLMSKNLAKRTAIRDLPRRELSLEVIGPRRKAGEYHAQTTRGTSRKRLSSHVHLLQRNLCYRRTSDRIWPAPKKYQCRVRRLRSPERT